MESPSRAPFVEHDGASYQVLAVAGAGAGARGPRRVFMRHPGRGRISAFEPGEVVFGSSLRVESIESGAVVFSAGDARREVRLAPAEPARNP